MEIPGYGEPLEYQPDKQEWAELLKRVNDMIAYMSPEADEMGGQVEIGWKSDELQKKFTLTRRPDSSGSTPGGWHYTLAIMEASLTGRMESGDSIIAFRDNEQGIAAFMGTICDEVDTGISSDPIENAELLLRLYLSSYTMDSDV